MRAQPAASALEKTNIIKTYKLHFLIRYMTSRLEVRETFLAYLYMARQTDNLPQKFPVTCPTFHHQNRKNVLPCLNGLSGLQGSLGYQIHLPKNFQPEKSTFYQLLHSMLGDMRLRTRKNERITITSYMALIAHNRNVSFFVSLIKASPSNLI